MAHRWQINESTFLYVEQRGDQTEALLICEGSRQSQSMTSLQTGSWTTAPQAFRQDDVVTVQIKSEQGDFLVCAQGSGLSTSVGLTALTVPLEFQVVEGLPETHSPFEMGDMHIREVRVDMNAVPAGKEMRVDWGSPPQSN